jgi:alpha-galactosidase
VLHWGADLGPAAGEGLLATAVPALLNNAPDVPRRFTVWPTERDGWSGTPAQRGNAAGTATTPRPVLVDAVCEPDPAGGGRIAFRFTDAVSGLRGEIAYAMDAFGVLEVRQSVERDAGPGAEPYTLDGLRALMPVPDRAAELLDFTGKWCRERSPQRSDLRFGTHSRRAHRGKPGHDTPYLMALGTKGFGFGTGEVWAAHLAWSGESEYLAERLPEGAGAFASVLGVGEQLHSGEVRLAAGDRYDAPPAVFAWSDQGLDGIADRLHRRLRARAAHPPAPRPLMLNTWEAVYNRLASSLCNRGTCSNRKFLNSLNSCILFS